jgi:hypothetical protein
LHEARLPSRCLSAALLRNYCIIDNGRQKPRRTPWGGRSRAKDGCVSTSKPNSRFTPEFFEFLTGGQDPTFAREFVGLEGLVKLKTLISEASGNTLAYGLTAFAKVLQVPDVQVEAFGVVDQWLVDRVPPPSPLLTTGT